MKQTPDDKRIEINLQPGTLSADGFLGNDSRDVQSIIRADQAVVDQLGLTHELIAERLKQLTEMGKEGLGAPVHSGPLEITVEDYRGRIFCPFRDRAFLGKRVTVCKDQTSGQSIRWSDLNVHMIEKHGFYEGQGSPFRVDPILVHQICFQ